MILSFSPTSTELFQVHARSLRSDLFCFRIQRDCVLSLHWSLTEANIRICQEQKIQKNLLAEVITSRPLIELQDEERLSG
jgi:hypothetical protein